MGEFRVPLVCLVPSDVALVEDIGAAQAIGEQTGASVRVAGLDDTPFLSDRIVRVEGAAAQLEAACLEVVRHLRESQGAGEEDVAPFVMLMPSAAAGAVVGARGSRVQALMKSSGADINVSREVLPRLSAQPVTVTGNLQQAAAAVVGVHAVLQELVAGGRLHVGDMSALLGGSVVASPSPAGGDLSLQDCVAALEISAPPVVLVVAMDIAGWIIGKQGKRVTELQRSSGARINVVNNSAAAGLRVGDRVLEIGGVDAKRRVRGVRAVFAAIAEAPTGDEGRRTALLVPNNAVGFVIGRGGETVREIMTNTGAEIEVEQSGPDISDSRVVGLTGSPEARAEAAVAIITKVEECRARLVDSPVEAPQLPAPRSRVGRDYALDGSTPPMGLGSAQSHADPPGAVQLRFQDPPAQIGPSTGGAGGRCVSGIPGAVPLKEMWSPASEAGADQEPTADERWMVEFLKEQATPAERALLASLQSSGALEQRLTIRVPEAVLYYLDDVSERSGARFELGARGPREDPGHHFVTAVGSRTATSVAALHLQECMASVTAS